MMLFKCGTCTYPMDSDVHGRGPCPMCNELRPQRLPLLERGDPGYEAPGGVVGKVVEQRCAKKKEQNEGT